MLTNGNGASIASCCARGVRRLAPIARVRKLQPIGRCTKILLFFKSLTP